MKVKVFTQYHLISIDPLPLFVNEKKGMCSPLILPGKSQRTLLTARMADLENYASPIFLEITQT